MPTVQEVIDKLDELLHDPKTSAVEFYVRTLRYWEQLKAEQEKENATNNQ
jgi:hypothetical protein